MIQFTSGPITLNAQVRHFHLPFQEPLLISELTSLHMVFTMWLMDFSSDASFEMMIIRRLYSYVDKGFRLEPDNASYKEKTSFCIGEPGPTPIADDARNADESASLHTHADH